MKIEKIVNLFSTPHRFLIEKRQPCFPLNKTLLIGIRVLVLNKAST